ncbi:MAG: UDP-2,3-diacylglucosamine diphosphatase [Paludibacteraceae bacterium]|nr:UDP-2,3-diacylglucosamine diphosphatase [Paludibacteraceae bacterium]
MVYFLSDAHLGSKVIKNPLEHQQKIIQLLAQWKQDADEIYLLGDIFDFWYEYIWTNRDKQPFNPFLDTLRQLTQQGIQVHYFIGNHDIWTFGWLQQRTGIILHRQPLSATIYGKSVFLAHGDGLVPQSMRDLPPVRAFLRLRAFFHHPVPQQIFRLLPPCIGNAFGYEWARRSRLKEINHPCPYKGENREELVLFAKEQEMTRHYDYYIFGHRHIDLDLMITPQSRVVVLGDMFKLFTYATLSPQGEIILNTVY